MLCSKAVLVIDDQQTQVSKFYVLGKKSLGADDQIKFARFQLFYDLFLLVSASKSGKEADANTQGPKSRLEGEVVLIRQDCGGGKNGNLFVVVGGLERRPNGNLCLAKTDIATHEPIHGLGNFHILLNVIVSLQLIHGFVIGKGTLQGCV